LTALLRRVARRAHRLRGPWWQPGDGGLGATWAATAWIEQAALDDSPLISVITPTHNRSRLLRRAVESVRAQVYPHWEIVVVDDGSGDDTPAAIDELCRALGDDRLRSIRISQSGMGAARNHALAAARGSLIAYLDDDNTMHPLWLKAVAWAFAERPDVDVLYGGIVIDDIVRRDRRGSGALPSYHLNPYDREALLRDNLADIGAIAHRSKLPEAHFDESLREMGDWDLLLRLTRDKPPLVLPAVAAFYHTAAADRATRGPTYWDDIARVRAKAARDAPSR
jgi:glycosyltransferase involved in cell wall biosynthesis